MDYIVVGGGIVGLATAYALLNRNPRYQLAVLEKESDWARHQTGRNSGVIHSGVYYKTGSLKATLCRQGNVRLQSFCQQHGIRYEICGKLIVATQDSELPRLKAIHDQAVANRIATRMMSAEEVRDVEPHVRCLAALHVPSTGIVDYIGVCRTLADLLLKQGAHLQLSTEVQRFRQNGAKTILETSAGDLGAKRIINCAGLHSDRVATMAGAKPAVRIVPFRGEYYELTPARRSLVRTLVYPVPDPRFPFLGVHFTRMIDGNVHAGPNAVLSFQREGYHRSSFSFSDAADILSYSGFWRLAARHARMGMHEMYRSFSKKAFVESLRKLVPEVDEDDLVPAPAGVRAQALRPDGKLVDDFLIVHHGSSTHVCNAPSPAATASLGIGDAIAAQLPRDD